MALYPQVWQKGKSPTVADGSVWEDAAIDWLERHGLRLVARNYRCRMGEIDLVMQDEQMLVFVEVRKRRHANYGGAVASIDLRKQHRLVLTAQHFLQRLGRVAICRFDVVLFEGDAAQPVWIRDAFRVN